MRTFLLIPLVLLLVMALLGTVRRRHTPPIQTDLIQSSAKGPLFILVPGVFQERATAALAVAGVLAGHGNVLRITYRNDAFSNADPTVLAHDIARSIDEHWQSAGQPELVLVGHSVGALLLRQAFLEGRQRGWGKSVSRVVLLAGMNRGWDISGQKPADMGWWRYTQIVVSSFSGRLAGTGKLILDMEAGSPFVSNLRLEWMNAFRDESVSSPPVVQLLGDIDDLVSGEDNADLRAAAFDNFVWIKVRGTGHGSITDMGTPQRLQNRYEDVDLLKRGELRNALRMYRAERLILAAIGSIDEVRAANEEQPFETDESVTDLLFVIHGIRDLGQWSSVLEQEMQEAFVSLHPEPLSRAEPRRRLVIEAARYGYFGMGPFVLKMQREKFVKWFMDAYTEARAKYPSLQNIHFVGHSNGTYLIANALSRYTQMNVKNVVLAGSVLPRGYDWETLINQGRVKSVRNYVASDDWVVALFPTVFEQWWLRWLGNDIGSAGFTGFSQGNALSGEPASRFETRAAGAVQNAGFIKGQHGAFINEGRSIAQFLLHTQDRPAATNVARPNWLWLKPLSEYGAWFIWVLLVAGVVWLGARVVVAGQEFSPAFFIIYVALVVLILRNL